MLINLINLSHCVWVRAGIHFLPKLSSQNTQVFFPVKVLIRFQTETD
jgi:hypothetical protein